MTLCDFNFIQYRKKANLFVGTVMISRAIKYELKEKKNFSNAEKLFEYLKEIFDEKKKRNEYFNDMDISAFQRSMGSLVRYSPSTKDSRFYFNLTLSEFSKPLRTSTLELILLNNLIQVHTSKGEMDSALVLVKTALEIGVFYQHIPHLEYHLSFFLIESRKVLNYHGLEFNSDRTDVQKITKK